MDQLLVKFEEGRDSYCPGEELRGEASWRLKRAPRRLEARLCWYTFGAVVHEAGIVDIVRFERIKLEEARPFVFHLPEGPHSFEGLRVSLKWAVELIIPENDYCARTPFTMGCNGETIALFPFTNED